MDDSPYAVIGFFILGIGFFLFVIHYIVSDGHRQYNQELNERREFGFGVPLIRDKRKRGRHEGF